MNDTLTTRGVRRAGRRGAGTTGMLVVLALLAAACVAPPPAAAAAPPGAIDLNSAPLETVLSLPVPPEVAKAIVAHRDYVSYFGDVYELLEVPGMTPALFAKVKPLVVTMPPPPLDASIARLDASYRQVRQYMSQEGSNEGLADEYLDRMRMPENINELDLFDLMSYQNVSPVDATNILKARARIGRFESQRQLRGTDGLRYFSFRNLRDFVVFSDEEKEDYQQKALNGYVQTRYTETPRAAGDDEVSIFALRTITSTNNDRNQFLVGDLRLDKPALSHKVRVQGRDGFNAGMIVNRNYGDLNWDETVKGFVGLRDRRWGDFRLKGLYFGNYRAAFGLGLIMDNTDFAQYRKTGYGFNKRPLGISGDLSRSFEYHLQGAAFEGTWKSLYLAGFWSMARKDCLVNPDGTINRYVVMDPRPDGSELLQRTVAGQHTGLRRRAMDEDLYGGNLKLMLAPGTFVGVTGYEARYNRGFNPDPLTLVTDQERLEARDLEIWDSYNSVVENPDGTTTENKWRRVAGAEAQAVVGNVAVQGEYAFLQDPRNPFFSTKNPDAVIVNTFAQWNDMHFLAIWRDYDVGFDNPYDRAFANDNRYEMTLLDSPYRLNDDLYAWLEMTTPQPKPEKGLFLETRYRISRQLTLSGLQFDQWKRKADGADLMRYTIKAEYQPIFNLRFRVRHRYSSRSEDNPDDVRAFRNWETRWQLIAMLSNYNRLGFTYVTSNVFFPARQRLSGTAGGTGGLDPAVGTAASPAHAFEARYEHNLSSGIKLIFASTVYDGFFWNFEGDDFVLLDGRGFRNWFKVESRVSPRLLFQLKVTRDHNLPQIVDIRDFGDLLAPTPDASRVTGDDTLVRLQMDYTF